MPIYFDPTSQIVVKTEELKQLNKWLHNPETDKLANLNIVLSVDMLRPIVEIRKAQLIAELKELVNKL